MTYNFSMEKVLEYREGIEKGYIEKFSHKQNQVLSKQQELKTLMDEHHAIKKKTGSYKNISEMNREQLYRQNLADKITEEKKLLSELIKDLELTRDEMISAQKDKKIMEKLKEKEFNKFQYKVKVSEEKKVDEVNTLRFVRGDL